MFLLNSSHFLDSLEFYMSQVKHSCLSQITSSSVYISDQSFIWLHCYMFCRNFLVAISAYIPQSYVSPWAWKVAFTTGSYLAYNFRPLPQNAAYSIVSVYVRLNSFLMNLFRTSIVSCSGLWREQYWIILKSPVWSLTHSTI